MWQNGGLAKQDTDRGKVGTQIILSAENKCNSLFLSLSGAEFVSLLPREKVIRETLCKQWPEDHIRA